MKTQTQIFFTGDTHIKNLDRLYELQNSGKYNSNEAGVLIVLGDSAFCWSESSKDLTKQLQGFINAYMPNLTLLSVLGNHENYDMIGQLPIVEKFGARMRQVSESIFYIMNGETMEINGETFAVMGGGVSIDKEYRIEGETWWHQEIPTKTTQMEFLDKMEELTRTGIQPILLTHTFAENRIREIDLVPFTGKLEDPMAKFFNAIELYPHKHWLFGHFHMDKEIAGATCMYEKIISLESILENAKHTEE